MGDQREVDGRALRDNEETRRLADVFKALGDPTRIALLYLLSHGEMNVGQLARAVGADDSISAVSHHLRVLREARIVDCVRRGPWAYYFLRPDLSPLARATVDEVLAAQSLGCAAPGT